jgi:hypothetical protein
MNSSDLDTNELAKTDIKIPPTTRRLLMIFVSLGYESMKAEYHDIYPYGYPYDFSVCHLRVWQYEIR